LAIQLDRQIALIRSRDLPDTARWIAALAERERFSPRPLAPTFAPIAPPSGAHPAAHRARRPSPQVQPQEIQSEALRRIPGVGPVRAAALLVRFGSIQRLLAAGEAELAAVEGIGPALARAIRTALNRK
jgi:ERCC4-type nuclease